MSPAAPMLIRCGCSTPRVTIGLNSQQSEPYKTSLIIPIVTGIIQLWDITPAPKKSFFDHMNEAREEAQMGAAALSREEKAAKDLQIKERRAKESKETKWKVPKAVDGSFVKVPKGDIRVRIRRRENLPAKAVVKR